LAGDGLAWYDSFINPFFYLCGDRLLLPFFFFLSKWFILAYNSLTLSKSLSCIKLVLMYSIISSILICNCSSCITDLPHSLCFLFLVWWVWFVVFTLPWWVGAILLSVDDWFEFWRLINSRLWFFLIFDLALIPCLQLWETWWHSTHDFSSLILSLFSSIKTF